MPGLVVMSHRVNWSRDAMVPPGTTGLLGPVQSYEIKSPKYLEHFVVQNSWDFLCWFTQPIYFFNRVTVLHLNRLKEGTWLHSFDFINTWKKKIACGGPKLFKGAQFAYSKEVICGPDTICLQVFFHSKQNLIVKFFWNFSSDQIIKLAYISDRSHVVFKLNFNF